MVVAKELFASFEQFVSLVSGSKEVGIVIAKNDDEVGILSQLLEYSGFKLSKNIDDLSEPSKTFMNIDRSLSKDVYDFIVQYPLGRIEIIDHDSMQTSVFLPDYNKLCLVILVSKVSLDANRRKGFNLLSVVGPAFQM